jgi:O-antigen/teichoic acid export membrane protein
VSTRGGGSYGRSVLISVAAVAAMSLMALANNVVIARAAGPEGRGIYGLAVAIGALALPIASLGLGSAATWQLGRGRPLEQLLYLARRVVLVSLALGLVSAGVVSVGFELGLAETALWAVLAAGLALPAQVIVELGRGFALGRRRPLIYNLCSATVIAALLGLNLLSALTDASTGDGPSWVLVNLVLANWVVAVVLVVWALRRRSERAEPALMRGSLSYGLRSAVVALGDAALLRIDYLVAAPVIGLAALGIYAIADQITHLMAWAGLLAGKMMLPEAASDDAEGRRSLAKLALACRLIIAVVLAGAGVAIVLGPWLIELLFGAAFADAYLATLILLPATLCKSLHALISTWLQGRGDQQPIVRASAAAVCVEAVAVLIFALSFGWLGVAAAKAGAYAVQLGLALVALRRHRAGLPGDDGHLLPGGRWLLDRSDLALLRAWLEARRRRS